MRIFRAGGKDAFSGAQLHHLREPLHGFYCRASSVYLLKMTSFYFLNITVLTDFEGIAERTETGSQLRFGSV